MVHVIVFVIAGLSRTKRRIRFVYDIDEIEQIRPFVQTQTHASLGGFDVARTVERLKPLSHVDATITRVDASVVGPADVF